MDQGSKHTVLNIITTPSEGQEFLIDTILSGRTQWRHADGAGKSICFQVPALLMNGITLVVFSTNLPHEGSGRGPYPGRRPGCFYQQLPEQRRIPECSNIRQGKCKITLPQNAF